MPTFKNLKQMEAYLSKIIQEVLEVEVYPIVRDAWLDMQEEKVYGVYQPVEYERRDKDGLSDPDNIKYLFNEIAGGLYLEIMNVAKGNPSNGGKRNPSLSHFPLKEDDFLNPYIESQQEFDKKKGGGFLPPRPYTEATRDYLAHGIGRNLIKQALYDGLKKHGINIKFN